jgi:hypothetical protein
MAYNFFNEWQDSITVFRAEEMNAPLIELDCAIDALSQITVIDRDLNSPPGSPATGAVYIAATIATGTWGGRDQHICYYSGATPTAIGWTYFIPKEGWQAYIQDENKLLYYDGSSWQEDTSVAAHQHSDSAITGQPYAVAAYYNGKPTASEELMRHVPALEFMLPSGLTGSSAKAGAAAAATTNFYLYKNTTQIGRLRFASGATQGTFTFSSAVTFETTSQLVFSFGATTDTTLAKIALTLKGSR